MTADGNIDQLHFAPKTPANDFRQPDSIPLSVSIALTFQCPLAYFPHSIGHDTQKHQVLLAGNSFDRQRSLFGRLNLWYSCVMPRKPSPHTKDRPNTLNIRASDTVRETVRVLLADYHRVGMGEGLEAIVEFFALAPHQVQQVMLGTVPPEYARAFAEDATKFFEKAAQHEEREQLLEVFERLGLPPKRRETMSLLERVRGAVVAPPATEKSE